MPQALHTQLHLKNALNYVVSREEDAVIEFLHDGCSELFDSVRLWSIHKGFYDLNDSSSEDTKEPYKALDMIKQKLAKQLYILLDFHPYFSDPFVQRALKELIPHLHSYESAIVFISSEDCIPDDLRPKIALLNFPLPDIEEIQALYQGIEDDYGLETISLEEKEYLICSGLGLTRSKLQKIYAQQFENPDVVDCESLIIERKKQIIASSPNLQFYQSKETLANVGGVNDLKRWLSPRGKFFSSPTLMQSLPSPKGIVISGIPGVGKSLLAKSIAGEWRLPLVKINGSQLFDNRSELSDIVMREIITKVESIAPAILWIDELDKPFTGMMHNPDTSNNDYTFPAILNWLQDKTSAVFVIATANDISTLPPALLRKGRFDELFYIDLPMHHEREEIIAIHLHNYLDAASIEDIDIVSLADASPKLTGAEIEQGIRNAHFMAMLNSSHVTTMEILNTFKEIYPLARSMGDGINLMQQYATYRAKAASSQSDEFVIEPVN